MNTNNNSNNIVTTTTTTITTEKSNMNNSINGSNFIVGSPVIAPSSQQQQQQQQPQQQQQQPSKANNENSITNAPSNGVAQPPQQQQQQSTVQTIGGQVTSNSNGTATANVIANQLQLANTSNLNNSNNTNNNNNSTSLTNNSMPCSSISGSLASNDEHQQQQQQLHHHHHHHHQQSQPHHHNHHHHHNQQQQQQHQHHHQQGGHNEHLSKTNLYIRGLEADATDDYLYNLCSKYGTISSTKAILDRITNSCKGYGFVDFESPQAAEIAVQELLKQGILAQMAKVRPVFTQHHHNQNSMNNSYDQDPTNLYLANLPPHMNEQELENLLSHYGPVVSTRILRDPSNNLPRGVGFARMETRDKCEQIIKHLNGKPCKGGSEPLLVKFADGGIRKRMHHHKIHNDNRWRDSGDIGLSNFDHQPGVSHNNLPNQMMTHGYPRTAHGYPGSVTASPYPAASSAQWLHPSQTGQPYVIPSSVMPTSGLDPSSQAAAALHYVAPMPQLTAQMQSLQLGPHSGQSVGGYLQHQQWAPQQLWAQMQHQQQQQQQQPLQQQTQQQFAQQPPQPGKSQQQSKGNTPSVPGGDWLAVDRS